MTGRTMKRPVVDEQGSALLLALVFTTLLTAIGAGLITMTNTERAAADNFRSGMAALYSAEGLAQYTVAHLSARSQWTSALCCGDRSSFVSTSTVQTAWRQEVDVDVETADVQRETDATFGTAPNRPMWRPYAWGPFETLVGDTTGPSSIFVLGWVADDRSEIDNDPLVDGNGLILVRTRAIGFRGLRRTLELVLKRVSNDSSASTGSDVLESGGGSASSAVVAQDLPDPSGDTSESAPGSHVQVLSWREVQ